MDVKIGIGLFIAIIVGVAVMIPITNDVIASSAVYGTNTEYFNITNAPAPHALFYSPLYSWTSLYRSNSTTLVNNTGIAGFHGIQRLYTTNPSTYTGASGVLTIECENASTEGIAIQVNGHSLGLLTYCPMTYLNVSPTWLGNSYTNFTFMNNGTVLSQVDTNTTAILQGIGTDLIYYGYTPIANSLGNLTVYSNFTSGDHVAVYIEGILKGNMSSSTESWNSINISAFTDPINVTFVNTNIIASTTKSNTSAGNFTTYPLWDVYMPKTATCAGATITVAYQQEAGTNISLRYNGHLLGTNLSGTSPQTWTNGTVGGPDNGWECDVGDYSRFGFEGDTMTNKTNITSISLAYPRYTNATNINNVSFATNYNIHTGNLTNFTLANYYEWRADTPNATSLAAGTVTTNTNGTFRAIYVFGSELSPTTQMILSLVPVFLALLIIVIIAMAVGVVKI